MQSHPRSRRIIRSGFKLELPFIECVNQIVGSDIGFIMIPGAQIPGELYTPLAEEIQRQMADK